MGGICFYRFLCMRPYRLNDVHLKQVLQSSQIGCLGSQNRPFGKAKPPVLSVYCQHAQRASLADGHKGPHKTGRLLLLYTSCLPVRKSRPDNILIARSMIITVRNGFRKNRPPTITMNMKTTAMQFGIDFIVLGPLSSRHLALGIFQLRLILLRLLHIAGQLCNGCGVALGCLLHK